MKFCKRYREYMEEQEKQVPLVELKKLKTVLKNCGNKELLPKDRDGPFCDCPQDCSVCDEAFFPSLVKDMSEILNCFNKRAQKLLQAHLASGLDKYILLLKNKLQGNHINLIKEGKDLVTYVTINVVAIKKILKKYDKIHCSMKGQRFRSEAHLEILKSPWLCELMAFHINLRESKYKTKTIPGLFEDCLLQTVEGRSSLSVTLFDSIKPNVDLTCSICLETVFDPVCLRCGHIFCHMCACSAAAVTTIDGLKASNPKSKCPLCRQERVFKGTVRLGELSLLLSRSMPEYWEERLRKERLDRIKQAKEYWESQCRAFVGYE